MDKKKIVISILLFTSISFGQNIVISKNTLKYLSKYPFYPKMSDTLHVYNIGNRVLSIDSIQMFSSNHRIYLFSTCYHDSVKNIGYLDYRSRIISKINISSSDSALFIFQYLPPITKQAISIETKQDSIVFYNNSLNRPLLTIGLINEIPLSVDEPSFLPLGYCLYQNYPNPFNPSTLITFNLPMRTHAVVIIYDLIGRTIEKLFDKELNAGTHTIVWNASSYCGGVYFCTLKTENASLTKTMLFLK